jgi:hypothetical protein
MRERSRLWEAMLAGSADLAGMPHDRHVPSRCSQSVMLRLWQTRMSISESDRQALAEDEHADAVSTEAVCELVVGLLREAARIFRASRLWPVGVISVTAAPAGHIGEGVDHKRLMESRAQSIGDDMGRLMHVLSSLLDSDDVVWVSGTRRGLGLSASTLQRVLSLLRIVHGQHVQWTWRVASAVPQPGRHGGGWIMRSRCLHTGKVAAKQLAVIISETAALEDVVRKGAVVHDVFATAFHLATLLSTNDCNSGHRCWTTSPQLFCEFAECTSLVAQVKATLQWLSAVPFWEHVVLDECVMLGLALIDCLVTSDALAENGMDVGFLVTCVVRPVQTDSTMARYVVGAQVML